MSVTRKFSGKIEGRQTMFTGSLLQFNFPESEVRAIFIGKYFFRVLRFIDWFSLHKFSAIIKMILNEIHNQNRELLRIAQSTLVMGSKLLPVISLTVKYLQSVSSLRQFPKRKRTYNFQFLFIFLFLCFKA